MAESPASFAVYALEINGAYQLRDPRDDGTECVIRTAAIDLLSYDRAAGTITITLRGGTTMVVSDHDGELYPSYVRWAFGATA